MKTVSRGIVSIIVCVVLTALFSVTVSAEDEVFVVSADKNGDANYMVRVNEKKGVFSPQENLMNDSMITKDSYGNGIGDFDNDGDFDYIMGDGVAVGNIILFEKIGSGNQFASPVAVAGWASGFFPMDMAVADFNEDGNLDFVMSYYFSSDCGLYLGDGDLGFTGLNPDDPATDHVLLENAAPLYSGGADAADFNNDGHADFVIAPYPIPGNSVSPSLLILVKVTGNLKHLLLRVSRMILEKMSRIMGLQRPILTATVLWILRRHSLTIWIYIRATVTAHLCGWPVMSIQMR